VGVPAAFVALAAVDWQPAVAEDVGIEEHRYADSLAVALNHAEHGYWVGYPDSRRVVDPSRQALIDAVLAEVRDGRWRASGTVLHVASTFEQWSATPLGVFAGVIETDAVVDPQQGVHTAGGRLQDLADLDALLNEGFDYVVVEGYEPGNAYLRAAEASGYVTRWANGQATLLSR
jgi:hypothetical protein